MSRRPYRTQPSSPGLPPVPPIPAAASSHGRSPSVSSTSSASSSAGGSSLRAFTNFPNASTSTIKLVPPSTPRPPSRSSATTAPPPLSAGIRTSPRAAMSQAHHQQQQTTTRPQAGPGFFDPTLMHPFTSTIPAPPPSQPLPKQPEPGACAMQSSMRKRSATEPSPTSPPLASSIMSSAGSNGIVGATATAVFHATAAMNIPHAMPHPPRPPSSGIERPTLPSPSTSAPEKTVPTKKESSKMKIFSKPGRIGTPGVDKTLRPPPSPNKMPQISSPIPRLVADDSGRRPSYSSAYSGASSATLVGIHSSEMGYSESPPATIIERGFLSAKEEGNNSSSGGGGGGLDTTKKKEKDHHSHKPHFLRSRRDKEHAFSSSSSNSKMVPDSSGSLYSFGPSSPSSSVFSSSKDLQKTISNISNMDISAPSIKSSKTTAFKSALGGASSTYEDSFLPPDLANSENPWAVLCARVLPLFEGDPLRNTVEDLNKLVSQHIRRCVERRDPVLLLHDVRTLLEAGMSSIEPRLGDFPDERLLTRLVEIWGLVFGYATPYLEAVFLPLQQEFKGSGGILSLRDSREFFGVDVAATAGSPLGLDFRRLVMIAMRDAIVLPVYERLKFLFSKLQLDFSGNQEEGMEVVARMLQCVSVLAAAGTGDDYQAMVDELGRRLKWNWLSRGRTGRNRHGFVGTKMRPVGVAGGGDLI